MKSLFICLVFILTVVSGCSNTYKNWSGEGEHWKGGYSANVEGNDENGTYTFRYKNGDKDIEFKNLEVSIDNGKTSRNEQNYKGTTVKISSHCTSCSVRSEDEDIKVNIKWGNKSKETFMLKPDK